MAGMETGTCQLVGPAVQLSFDWESLDGLVSVLMTPNVFHGWHLLGLPESLFNLLQYIPV